MLTLVILPKKAGLMASEVSEIGACLQDTRDTRNH